MEGQIYKDKITEALMPFGDACDDLDKTVAFSKKNPSLVEPRVT
jgi:hypothetical protein